VRTPLSPLTLLRPKTLAEALRMLRDDGPLTPIAGCTDVYVALNFGTAPAGPGRYLDLWPLDPLRRITQRDDVLSIGALASYAEIIRSRLVRKHLPMLVAAARQIGGVQIQNRGTLGGNIANGSPAGDSLPVLAAAGATIVLRSAAGERRVPFDAFYTGYRQSVLRPDELIVAAEIPPVEGAQWFRKVGTRAAQAISKVVMAAVRPATPHAPRIALGSVAATVVRLPRTERALADGASIEAAMEMLQSEIAPIDDLRSTADYRRHVAATLLRRWATETA
jgi:CO/xanthine dehydrogenase FAD-binding subunit